VSADTLLGGQVQLRQLPEGYRVAIDPVLLAAAVPAGKEQEESILDLGCGVGAASLCLARRVASCKIQGIERQAQLVRVGQENIIANDFAGRVVIREGDVLEEGLFAPDSFDHVMANPPFLAAGTSTPPRPEKAEATIEGEADLAAFVRVALRLVRVKGSITFIHRADRLEALLAPLRGRAGEITIFPLWPAMGRPAKRVIIRARKGVASPSKLCPGLVLHEAGGGFTAPAQAVLREGAGLPF